MSEQQFLNYLHWLKDRGQVFAFPAEPPLPKEEWASFAEPEANELAAPPASPSRERVRVLFVTENPLNESEAEMIMRIAAALGARNESFRIVLKEALTQFDPDFTVALGNFLTPSSKIFVVPHPSEMLKEPKLKVSAWENLQKLKAQL